jgi:hypothetical protein
MAYLRSIYLMSNKKIFNIQSIDVVKFSSSLGLVTAPRIRFLQKSQPSKKAAAESGKSGSLEEDEDEEEEPLNFSNITGPSLNRNNNRNDDDDDDEENDLFKVKQVFKFKPNILNKDSDDQSEDQSEPENNIVIVLLYYYWKIFKIFFSNDCLKRSSREEVAE